MEGKDLVGKFATINSEVYSEHGLNKGDTVVIAGSGFAPIDDDDNYKFLLVSCKITDGKMEGHGVTTLRKHLEVLPDDKCKELRELLEKNQASNEEVREETRH